MAVITPLTPHFITDVCRQFSLPPPHQIEPIAAGVTNTNYRLIWTDRSPHILTLIEQSLTQGELQFIDYCLSEAQLHGMIAPQFLQTKNHQKWVAFDDTRWLILQTHISGQAPRQPPDMRTCFAAGQLLARWHQLPLPESSKRRINPFGPAHFTEQYLAPLSQRPLTAQHQSWCVMAEDFLVSHAAVLHSLPTAICYLDFFPDNCHVLTEASPSAQPSLALIDPFYVACDDSVYDLMIALHAWTMKDGGILDKDRVQHFLSGYFEQQKGLQLPADHMNRMGALASMRFMLSRLRDLYQDEQYLLARHDPTPYAMLFKKYVSLISDMS